MLHRIEIKWTYWYSRELQTPFQMRNWQCIHHCDWRWPFWQHSQITLLHLPICAAAKHKAHSLAWKSETTWWKLFSSSHSFIQKRSGPVNSEVQRGWCWFKGVISLYYAQSIYASALTMQSLCEFPYYHRDQVVGTWESFKVGVKQILTPAPSAYLYTSDRRNGQET